MNPTFYSPAVKHQLSWRKWHKRLHSFHQCTKILITNLRSRGPHQPGHRTRWLSAASVSTRHRVISKLPARWLTSQLSLHRPCELTASPVLSEAHWPGPVPLASPRHASLCALSRFLPLACKHPPLSPHSFLDTLHLPLEHSAAMQHSISALSTVGATGTRGCGP